MAAKKKKGETVYTVEVHHRLYIFGNIEVAASSREEAERLARDQAPSVACSVPDGFEIDEYTEFCPLWRTTRRKKAGGR